MESSLIFPLRVMIIVWKWDNGNTEIKSMEGFSHDEWLSSDTKYLVCRLDLLKRDNVIDILTSLSMFHAEKERQVLMFLHKSPNHNFNENDISSLNEKLNGYHNKIRIRLFGEANGPIYYNQHSVYGILGADGNFADETYVGDEVVESELFIANRDITNLNSTHLDYIWNYYWFESRRLIFNLAEDIQIQIISGPDDITLLKPQAFIEYVQGLGDNIWKRMAYFSDNSILINNSTPIIGYIQNYDISSYIEFIQLNFNLKISLLKRNIKETKENDAAVMQNNITNITNEYNVLIKKVDHCKIQVGNLVTGNNLIETLPHIYDSLIDLYVSLPEDTA